MMNNSTALDGDRFITLKEIKTTGATTWSAPYTGFFDCVIPEGTILVVKYDQVKGARGFSCVPEKYKEFEKIFVPAQDRFQLKYGGYYFVFLNENIGTKLKLISRASIGARRWYEFKMKIRSWSEDIFVIQGLYILSLYIILFILLPFKPLVDFYRSKKLAAQKKAEEQNNKP